jgi:hypothetical protein
MNKKIISLFIIAIIVIFFSFTTIAKENNPDLNKNINYEKIFQNYKKISITPWYPGFFITLLLAPFIILYLIIAIILEIGN